MASNNRRPSYEDTSDSDPQQHPSKENRRKKAILKRPIR